MATKAQKAKMAAKRKRSAISPRKEVRRIVPDPAVDISTTESVERFDIPARGRPKNVTPRKSPSEQLEELATGLRPGAEVARELGIYLGQIYGYIKSGKVTNHKPAGEKGTLVDPEEVKAARDGGRRRGGKGGGAPREPKPEAAKSRVKPGDIVSWDKGQMPGFDAKGHAVGQVTKVTARTVTMERPGVGSKYYFTQDRLGARMARDEVRLENPTGLLGMILLQWIRDDKIELAKSLEKWMDKHDIQVLIPELEESGEIEEESAEPVVDSEDDEE